MLTICPQLQSVLSVLDMDNIGSEIVFPKSSVSNATWNPTPEMSEDDAGYWNVVGVVSVLEPHMYAHQSHIMRYYIGILLDMVCEAYVSKRYTIEEENVLFYGNFNDMSQILPFCNFWHPNSRKTHPILHIFNKALPIRCQVRNLKKVIQQYTNKFGGISTLLEKFAKASLLGNYPHCSNRPLFAERVGIYEGIDNSPHVLFFYAIKEYIIHTIHTTPALHDVLCKTYKWHSFERNITEVMDTVRTEFQVSDDWSKIVSNQLLLASKQQLKYVYCTGKQTFDMTLAKRFSQKLRHDIANVADVITCSALYGKRKNTWIQKLGISQTQISEIASARLAYTQMCGSKNTINFDQLPQSHGISIYYDSLFHEFSVKLFPLPSTWEQLQREAIIRKYGKFSRKFCTFGICTRCRDFKGILSDRGHVNTYAIGQCGVVLSCADDKIYCRNQKPGCGHTTLPMVNILGCVLQFYKRIIILCPNCAAPTYFSGSKYIKGVFNCGRCPKPKQLESLCSFCNLRIPGKKFKRYKTSDNKTVSFCTTCSRRWIRDGLAWNTIQTGIREDWEEVLE